MKNMWIVFALLFSLGGCASQTQSGAISKQESQLTESSMGESKMKPIVVTEECVDNLKTFILENYNFKPNYHRIDSIDEIGKGVYFRISHEEKEDEPLILDDRYVFIALKDSCKIDTVVSTVERVSK